MLQNCVWIDNSVNTVLTDPYWKKLTVMGFNLGAIMIDTARMAWDPIYTGAQFESACKRAIHHGGSSSAVIWPVPRKALIDQMCDDLKRNYLPHGVVGVEGDQEFLWMPQYLDLDSFGPKFASVLAKDTPPALIAQMKRLYPKPKDALERAGLYFVYKFNELSEEFDVWTAVTTHTGHREMTSRAVMTPRVTYLNGQFYSTETDWRKMPVAFDSIMGPGRRQIAAIKQLDRVPNMAIVQNGQRSINSQHLGIGLAGWDQKWAGHTVLEAVAMAFRESLIVNPRFIMVWSSKWIVAGHLSTSRDQLDVAAAFTRLFGVVKASTNDGEINIPLAVKHIDKIIDEERRVGKLPRRRP